MNDSVIKNHDQRSIVFAMFTATIMVAHQVAGKATRDALFLSNFPVSDLPKVVIAASLLSGLAVLLISRLISRAGPGHIVPAAFMVSAVLFVVEWRLAASRPDIAGVLLYLHMASFGAVLISGFWSVLGERFDPHTAKRRIPRVAAAAALGGVAGGLLADRVVSVLDLRAMLIVLSILHLACALGVLGIGTTTPPPGKAQQAPEAAGVKSILASPYLRSIATLMALVAVTAALLDYAIKAQATQSLTGSDQLARFFAIFYSVTGIVTFALQTGFGTRVLQRFGLTGALFALPGAVIMGGVFATAVTHLWTVMVLRGAESAVANSFFRSGFELLYTPLSWRYKRATKTIIDVGANRLGDLIGAGLLMALLFFVPNLPVSLVISIAMAAAVISLMLVNRLYRGYVDQLASSLREGSLTLDDADQVDSTTRQVLEAGRAISDRDTLRSRFSELESRQHDGVDPQAATPDGDLDSTGVLISTIIELTSGDPHRVRQSLRTSATEPGLVPFIVPLLADPELVDDARMELRWLVTRVTGQLTDALLDPDIPLAARERLPEVIEVWHSPRAFEALTQGLEATEFPVRRATALAMARMIARDDSLHLPRRLAYQVVERELEPHSGHTVVADTHTNVATSPELNHVFTVLGLALPQDALLQCVNALSNQNATERGTALEYLENVLPRRIRELLWPRIGLRYARAHSPRSRRQITRDLLDSSGEGSNHSS